MKKIWKILGVAALAGLIPYSFYNKDDSGKVTTYALLWKSTVEPDPETPGKKKITVDLGFHNPMEHSMEEAKLYADELQTELDTLVEEAPVEEAAPVEEYSPDDVIPF